MERILTFKAVLKVKSYFAVGSTTLTNTATLTHRDGSLSYTANVVVNKIAPQVGTISLTKNVRNVTKAQRVFLSSSTANPGDQVEFQMQVSASGGNVDNVIFSDQLPNRLIYVNNSLTVDGVASGNNLGVVSLGNFTSGLTKKVIIRATVAGTSEFPTGSTTLTNIANVTSNSNSSSASANVVVNIGSVTPVVNLNITKLVRNVTQNQSGFVKSAAANPGDTIQFQIQTSVSGNTAAQNVVVRDSLPSSVSLTSGSITNNLGTMNSGTTQTVNLTVTVASYNNFTCGSTTLTNSASASASNTNSVSDTASVIVTRNDNCAGGGSNPFLTLTKEASNASTSTGFSNFTNAAFGERVEFRLTVRNNNFNSTAYNLRLSDALPNGLTYVPGTFQIDSGTSSGNLFGGSNQWLGNLSGNQSRTILFQASVNASTSQTLINSATATSDNTNSANAQATVFVSTVAGGNIDLVLSKSAYNQTRNVDATTVTAQPGDVILYTLRVQNRGNATATNFVFQDDLADVLELSRLNAFEGAAFDLGKLSLSWPAVSIPAGATVEKTFSVVVNSTSPAGSDNVMTNVFGNTVNVRVARVAGTFTAPHTGAGSMVSVALAFATVLGYWGIRKQKFQSLIKFLTYKNV